MKITTNIPSHGNGQIQNPDAVPSQGRADLQQNGELSLANAAKGSVFQGNVIDIRGNQVQIQVGNAVLNALLESSVNVNIGEDLSFLIKENTGTRVLLKPFQNLSQSENQILAKSLEEASLPATERNMQAVKSMMSMGMSIDRESMTEVGKMIRQYPDIPAETLVSMKSFEIPVTEKNVKLFMAYQQNQAQLTDGIQKMFGELREMVKNTETPEKLNKLNDLMQELNKIVAPQDQTFSEIKNQADSGRPEKMQKDGETAAGEKVQDNSGKEPEKAQQATQKMSVTEQLLSEREAVQTDSLKDTLKSNLKILEENLKNKLFITPEKLAQQGEKAIKESYETLAKTLDKLTESLQNTGEKHSSLMNTAGDLKNNMSFMSDFNQMTAYVQLPMKLGAKEKNGELYVLSRKKKYEKDEVKTAFLHFDMENLGATDIRISLAGSRVSTIFTFDNDASMELVKEHLPQLQERLAALGYHAELKADVTQETKSSFERIIEAEKPQKEVKRYAFDVRA
mgnify:FL=1